MAEQGDKPDARTTPAEAEATAREDERRFRLVCQGYARLRGGFRN